jgi:hypothetical protein
MQLETGQEIDYTKGKCSAEMVFLRPVARYALLYQKRNRDMLSDLKICSLTERIDRQKESFYKHILKIENR